MPARFARLATFARLRQRNRCHVPQLTTVQRRRCETARSTPSPVRSSALLGRRATALAIRTRRVRAQSAVKAITVRLQALSRAHLVRAGPTAPKEAALRARIARQVTFAESNRRHRSPVPSTPTARRWAPRIRARARLATRASSLRRMPRRLGNFATAPWKPLGR